VARLVAIACCLLLLVSGPPVWAGCPDFPGLIQNGAYGVADSEGRLLAGCAVDRPFIPASIIKIATALVALKVLGPDYRFTTELYLDKRNNLYIRGMGDPLLISEEVALLLAELRGQGITTINSIYVDDSAFALEHQPPGRGVSSNPYDAPIGPASVNFNCVSFRKSRRHGVRSGEKQTPTLPLMRELGQRVRTGYHLINICPGGCREEARMARLTGELFRSLQKKAGIRGRGVIGRKQVPETAELVLVHANSRPLTEVLATMLHYSSNFIANLVFLTIGAHQYGYPATWAKARQAMHSGLTGFLGPTAAARIVMEEGAGLSRHNRITARAMLQLLKAFAPHADLLRYRYQVLVKSGTMKGIFNYAGYLPGGNPFVILLNQRRNTRRTVLARLKRKTYPQDDDPLLSTYRSSR
jgi:D-alanyl-D-alanine carboxypeptidase/D-alanyl-D-alanine-endopeptidase (penicillin-binding protein 4)